MQSSSSLPTRSLSLYPVSRLSMVMLCPRIMMFFSKFLHKSKGQQLYNIIISSSFIPQEDTSTSEPPPTMVPCPVNRLILVSSIIFFPQAVSSSRKLPVHPSLHLSLYPVSRLSMVILGPRIMIFL